MRLVNPWMRIPFLRKLIVVWGGLLLSCAPFAPAEEEVPVSGGYLVSKWTQDDGLPDNSVSAIAQADDGCLWIGTYDGAARFDGLRFTSYLHGSTLGMPDGKVRAIAGGAGAQICFGFEDGAITCESGGVFRVILNATGSPDDWLASLARDKESRLCAGMSKLRLLRREGNGWAHLEENGGLRGAGGVQISSDALGKLWFATDDSYGTVDETHFTVLASDAVTPRLLPRKAGGIWLVRGSVLTIRSDKNDLLYGVQTPWRGGASEVQALIEDHEGRLWIGTKGQGLFRFDGEFERVPASHGFILSLAEDREGNIWAGTLGGGLVRLHPRQVLLHNEAAGFPADVIDAVCEDGEGALWLAARNAGVIRFLDGKAALCTKDNGWPGGYCGTLSGDGSGGVLFGTLGDGVVQWSGGTFSRQGLRSIDAVFAVSRSDAWAASDKGVFRHIGGAWATTESLARATCFCSDAKGQIWAGTAEGGLFRFTDSRWQPAPGVSKSVGAIRTLAADDGEVLWIGAKRGLVRYADGKSARFGRAEGLPSEDIRQVVLDGPSLWCGSARGLFRVSRTELAAFSAGKRLSIDVKSFGQSEGLGSVEFAEGGGRGACRTKDGRLWFASRQGAFEVNPAKVVQSDAALNVHIDGVSIGDKPMQPLDGGAVHAPPLTQKIEIDYVAVCLSAPESVRFRYRVLPDDPTWSGPVTTRSATFIGLRPGRRQFQVSTFLSGSSEADAPIAKLDVFIEPALWQRGWFRALSGAAIVAVAVLLARIWTARRFRERLRALERERALENERARIARDMHDELGANLTSICLLAEQIRTASQEVPAAVAERIEKVGRAARAVSQTLDEIVWTVNPRNDSIEGLTGYLLDYASEYLGGAGIRARLDAPESFPHVPVSSDVRHELLLAVKEALNNAVKYSGSPEVELRIRFDARAIAIRIADKGRGFDLQNRSASRNGLRNMEHRLSAIGGQCAITSAIGAGTSVDLIAPFAAPHSS